MNEQVAFFGPDKDGGGGYAAADFNVQAKEPIGKEFQDAA